MKDIVLLAVLKKLKDRVDSWQTVKGEQGERGEKGEKGDSLKGEKGDTGEMGVGQDGRDGDEGKPGKDGEDGVSVTDVQLAADDSLSFFFSDGTERNVEMPLFADKGPDTYISTTGGGTPSNTGEGTATGITYVSSPSDLPPCVGGVHTLLGDHTYLFTGYIDLVGCRLVGALNTCILGFSSENAFITSTGLGVGVPLFYTEYTTPIRHVTFHDVDTALEIQDIHAAPLALDWTGVNFADVPNIGLINGCDNFIFTKGAFLGSEGLVFDGSNGTIGIADSLCRGSGAASPTIEVAATATITRRFRVIYSSVIAFGSTTGIDVNASATIPIEGFILDTVSFSGGGTYLPGVSTSSNIALFSNCINIVNTSVNGQAYMLSNTTATTVSAKDTFYKVAGTTTASADNEKYTHTNNRLTNDAAVERKYMIQVHISFTSGSNNICEFGFYDSKLGGIRQPSRTLGTANSAGRLENLSSTCVVQHVMGDYVEIWCANTSSTSNITVETLNFIITEIN